MQLHHIERPMSMSDGLDEKIPNVAGWIKREKVSLRKVRQNYKFKPY
jgi:hypothetical protein